MLEGSEAFIDFQRSTAELTPDARLFIHHHLEEGRIGLRVMSLVGTIEGSSFQNLLVSVHQTDATGRVTRRDFYAPEQLAEALARYDELVADQARHDDDGCPERFVNAAIRCARRSRDAMNAGDLEATLACFAPGCTWDDRRALNRTSIDVTSEAGVGGLSSILAAAGVLQGKFIATRGDALCISHSTWRRDNAEIEALILGQVDDTERFVHVAWYEPGDLDAAYAELDARHGGTGPLYRGMHAYNARDWDAFAACFEDTADVEDHRPVGWGRLDVPGLVERYRMTAELSPDPRARLHHVVDSAEGAVLAALAVEGTHEGGAFERPFLTATAWGPHERFTVWHIFEIDDLDHALACAAELAAAATEVSFANLATAAQDRFAAAYATRDWDAATATFGPDLVASDRRAHVRLDLPGAEVLRDLFDAVEVTWERQLLATRGDRLAQERWRVRSSTVDYGRTDDDLLQVTEVDELGRLTALVTFEHEQLEEAYDELDARYVALGGHDVGAIGRATAAQDWDALAAQLTPDFRCVDRRVLGMAEGSLGDYLRDVQTVAALAPDNRIEVHHVLASSPLAVHSLCRAYGTRDGARTRSRWCSSVGSAAASGGGSGSSSTRTSSTRPEPATRSWPIRRW